jgi:integrase
MTDLVESSADDITFDNIHLSQPIIDTGQCGSVNDFNSSIHQCTDPKILEFIAAATAENTRRAYQCDLRHFLARGGRLPATSEQVARYLADHAASLSMATLARRLAGVRAAHVARGFPDPTKGDLIRLTLRGIRRRYGKPQRRVAPMRIENLSAIISVLGDSRRDIRDCALLLVGFAGAFRRSELGGIQCDWISHTEQGLSIALRKTKTDQESKGRRVVVPRVDGQNCPVAALETWLKLSRIIEGPLFRRISKSGKILMEGLSASALAAIVKRRAAQIGLDPAYFSGHSLRAGFATSAAVAGMPMWRIKRQTGHVSDAILSGYIREAETG